MSTTLYDATVRTYQQILGSVSGYLEKGRAHFEENGIELDDIVQTRIYEDMLPFAFQLNSVVHHSRGAIEGVRAGVCSTPPSLTMDYVGWQQHVADAAAWLDEIAANEINSMEGTPVEFKMGSYTMPFLAEDYLLTFSLPNFYFHATTAYDILRMRGVPVGKGDFLGRMRLNKS